MSVNLVSTLEHTPVMPLVIPEDPATAVSICRALCAGGLQTAEIVLRTDRALDAIRAVAQEVPEALTGAGTVLNAAQAEAAIAAGATFLVSPGLDEGVVAAARDHGVPILPGVYTPTELQQAFNLGLDIVKFFPASIAGGIPALQAFSNVFRSMRFMPTGGITLDNLADFLALPSVLACGGSWLTPASAVAAGDFAEITRLAREAADAGRRAKRAVAG